MSSENKQYEESIEDTNASAQNISDTNISDVRKNTLSYVPLRVHSDYSLLDAIIKPTEIVDIAIEKQFPSIAITDNNNLFAAPEYSFYARKKGFPAILGCLLTTDHGNVLLYCKNNIGYKNLCQILSDFYVTYKQKYPIKALENHYEGLVLLIGGPDGFFEHHSINSFPKDAFQFLHNIFKEDLILELNRTEGKHHTEELISKLSKEYNIPVVGTSTAKYLNNSQAYQASKAVNNGEVLTFENKSDNEQYKLLTYTEFAQLFSDCTQVVENTILFAEKCSFLLEETEPRFPFFSDNAKELLIKWANEGLEYLITRPNWFPSIQHQYKDEDEARKVYYERLNYELDMIISLGFTDYFLIVADFVKWARDNKISLSARGSGAGSLVAWTLFITTIDPIHFGLFFERFINPGRVSLPDFDIDFCQERREEVITYVKQKYGKELIAQIITFGTWHSRGVLRDVGRVLGLQYGFIDKLCKRIPNKPNFSMTLSEALEADAELKAMYDDDQNVKRLFDISLELEGLHRHISTHAAGVIIGYDVLKNIIPLYISSDMAFPATQYVMTYIEKVGLVKFDFLGLTALTIIDQTLAFLATDNIFFDINQIDCFDTKIYQLLCQGLTAGVFQFESAGLTSVIVRLQPSNLEDLIAIISLYRPGPLENIGEFIARKHGLRDVSYEYPAMEEILQPTYGIIVYQEQVINIARVLAGYTLSEADLLRRAMGKKIAKEMEEHREKFVHNVVKDHGGTAEKATDLFDQIVKFSGYAFNKAHAASHAFIGYQTAYLKTYYPLEFMTVSLTLEKQRHDKISNLAKELKALDLKMHKPDVNKSTSKFTFEKPNIIIYCLSAIKSVGDAFADNVFNIKSEKKFDSVETFCSRILPSKNVFEALILSGAFDSLPVFTDEKINTDIHAHRNRLFSLKDSLLNVMGRSIFQMQEGNKEHFDIKQLLINEWKYTGWIFSTQWLKDFCPITKNILISGQVLEFCRLKENRPFYMQGFVLDKQLIKTKQGSVQWAVKCADTDGVFEIFVKSEIHDKNPIQIGQVLIMKTKLIKTYLIAQDMQIAHEAKERQFQIYIKTETQLTNVHEMFQNASNGSTKVILCIDNQSLTIGNYNIELHYMDLLDLHGIRYKFA